MKLRIIATDTKYRIAPFYIAARYDEGKKKYLTGQTWDTDPDKAKKQKENTGLVLDEDSNIPIKHNMVLDDEVEVDRIILGLIALHPEVVAATKSSVIPDKHRFYIENKETEAKVVINKTELKFDAISKIKSMSLQEQNDFARLMGKSVSALSKSQIEAYLYEECEMNPDRIISFFNDSNKKYKVFVNNLIDAGVLRMSDGKYLYNEEIIGLNIDYAIGYVKDRTNEKVVVQWSKMLKGKEVEA